LLIDTNILVFSTQVTSPRHSAARQALERARATEPRLFVTHQILREYLAVVTRPQGLERPLARHIAVERVGRFRAMFEVLQNGDPAFERLIRFVEEGKCGGRAIHDANIAATMMANGVSRILTDNGADFRRFAPDIEIVDLA
jgi:predicted nucleic acid-binding protein